jgi:hypothetical protein
METRITLTLPGDGLVGTATIHVEQGDNVLIGEIPYKTLADIAEGIGDHLRQLQGVQFPTTGLSSEDTWDPDLEAKRQALVPGVWVKTPDGVGTVAANAATPPEDEVWVAIDGYALASYPLVALVQTTAPKPAAPAQPETGDVTRVAATTVQATLTGEADDAQLTLF